jgi:hypothetical protein
VEVVDAVFAFDGVAATIVRRGAQAALHVFAERDVFLLDFVTEGDGLVDAFACFGLIGIVKKPFKNSERFFG